MKVSSVTSAKAETAGAATPLTGRSSAKHPPTPTAEQFALGGPSDLPDPRFHAYRKDLADVALAGRVVASHYAEPVRRTVAIETALVDRAGQDAQPLTQLSAGEEFLMLDDSLGWAWGYAGAERIAGYLPSGALKA